MTEPTTPREPTPQEDSILRAALMRSVKIVGEMPPVDRALMESDQRRSWVKGETGRDPGDVLADEVRSLRESLTAERAARQLLAAENAGLERANDLLGERLDAAERALAEARQQWIPVSERKPEYNQTVFAWMNSKHGGFPDLIDEWRDEYADQVTHWKPADDPVDAAIDAQENKNDG